MSITATELKINLGKYLMLAETEDIYITRNGSDEGLAEGASRGKGSGEQ